MGFHNGEMVEHKEAKSSALSSSNGEIVEQKESSFACAHGRCSESVTLAKPGSVTMMTQQGPAARFAPLSGFIQARLNKLISRFPGPAMRPMPETQPTLTMTNVVETRPEVVLFLAPHAPSTQTDPRTQASAAWERMHNDTFKYAVCIIVAGGFLLTLIASSIMMWYISESRELPLHSLSEPLADMAAEGMSSNMTPHSVVVEPKVHTDNVEPAVKDYLEQMYARAAQRAHLTASKMYLSRVYVKTCM